MLIIICAAVIAATTAGIGYRFGRVRGCNDTLDLIQKPALEFLAEWYPLGVPKTTPQSALDVMAQILEPMTKL